MKETSANEEEWEKQLYGITTKDIVKEKQWERFTKKEPSKNGSNNELVGYALGLDMKKYLLDLEREVIS